jgi:hypothetical protein
MAMDERTRPDYALHFGPSIEFLKRSDGAVPRRGRDASADLLATASSMKRSHVATLSFPDALVAGLLKKANPDHDVVAIGPKGMPGPHAVQRQIEEKTIEIAVIDSAIAKDYWDMMIKTIDCTLFLKRDILGFSARIVIHNVPILLRTPSGVKQSG